jgi:hypothetical protein
MPIYRHPCHLSLRGRVVVTIASMILPARVRLSGRREVFIIALPLASSKTSQLSTINQSLTPLIPRHPSHEKARRSLLHSLRVLATRRIPITISRLEVTHQNHTQSSLDQNSQRRKSALIRAPDPAQVIARNLVRRRVHAKVQNEA